LARIEKHRKCEAVAGGAATTPSVYRLDLEQRWLGRITGADDDVGSAGPSCAPELSS